MCGLFEKEGSCSWYQSKCCLRFRNPKAQMGLVPQRMPAITWRDERQSDPGYALLDINPITGEQRYPYLRFDDNSSFIRYQIMSCVRPVDKVWRPVSCLKIPRQARNNFNSSKAA
jgi:hypothetical protein